MEFKNFQIEYKSVTLKNSQVGEYVLLTINHPPMNVLSSSVLQELDRLVTTLEQRAVRVMVLTGAGRAFVAGADISEMQGMSQQQATEYSRLGHGVFRKIEKSSIISIAAVNGFVLGGGLELALACDMRFFSDKAIASTPEVSLGLIPGFGATQRLTRIVGEGNAKYLILTGEKIDAQTAFAMHLAQKVVAHDDLLVEAEKAAVNILHNGPAALRQAKQLVHEADDVDFQLGLDAEAMAFGALFVTGQPQEGMRAFLEKRAASF